MSTLPIFIVNLAESSERRESITKQFNSLQYQYKNLVDIDYSFFSAINGKAEPDFPLFSKYNRQKRFLIKGNTMSLGQLGCFASHYLLWQKCLELNHPIIVLEDDISILDNFIDVYQFCLSQENNFEFFWLGYPSKIKHSEKNKIIYLNHSKNFSIRQYYKGWENTNGYYITPQAAHKLISYCSEWVYNVDISMDRYWENKLQYLAIYPPCIQLNTLSQDSTIAIGKGGGNRTFFTRLRREYFNLKDRLKRAYFNYKNP